MRMKMLLFGPGLVLFAIGALTYYTGGSLTLVNALLMALGLSLAGVSFMHKRWGGDHSVLQQQQGRQAKNSSRQHAEEGDGDKEDNKDPRLVQSAAQ